jgi:hypothetical protein
MITKDVAEIPARVSYALAWILFSVAIGSSAGCAMRRDWPGVSREISWAALFFCVSRLCLAMIGAARGEGRFRP